MRNLAAWCHDRRRTRHRPLGRSVHRHGWPLGHRRGRLRQQLQPAGHRVPAGLRPAEGQVPSSRRVIPPPSSSRSRTAACSTPATSRRSRRSAPRSRSRPRCSPSATPSPRAPRSPRTARSPSRRSSSARPPATSIRQLVKTMAENTLKLDGKGGVQVALGGDIIHWSTAEQGGAGEIFGLARRSARAVPHARRRRDGPAAAQRPVRDGRQPLADGRGRDPRARRRRLDAAARGDDRHRRRHRLRAADPQPLPAWSAAPGATSATRR